MVKELISKLEEMRKYNGGNILTHGLSPVEIEKFSTTDKKLPRAINAAYDRHVSLRKSHDQLLKLPEVELAKKVQDGYLNFYPAETISPYVPLSAYGPWVVTSCGAVVHDSGGYGMLGFGHSPEELLPSLNRDHVMANVMTPSFEQYDLMERLHKEIGHTRKGELRNPFTKFMMLNSGSEAVAMAARLADANAKIQTDPGGKHAGKKVVSLAHTQGFHGRTDSAARVSDSSLGTYRQFLASFRNRDHLITVEANNVEALRAAFAKASADNVFIEAVFVEPVMGEGRPGVGITPEYYQAARELTLANDAFLIVDSIQAGLRTHGCLSAVDYPGFADLLPPDVETYSKAVNGGQFPLSILAMTPRASAVYRTGLYGNTMTTNPRALDVACAVLDNVTPELRANIRDRGVEAVNKFRALAKEVSGIVEVQGTGLLFAVELDPQKFKVVGVGCIEEQMRRDGIGVIHGGKNALRFTPHLRITSAEIDLIVEKTRKALSK